MMDFDELEKEETEISQCLASGTYRVVSCKGVDVTSTARGVGAVVRNIKKGTLVEVVQLQHIDEDDRIRGRLATGGWITIKDAMDGFMWVQPDSSTRATMGQ